MNESIHIQGYIRIETWDGTQWVPGYEGHNVTNVQYKNGLAASLAGGTQIIPNKITVGTTNTSFTASSTNLTTEVGSTTSLTLSVSGGNTTNCAGVVMFTGNYTIQEAGLWFGNIPLAFGNVNQTVTALSPIRISWSITHL
jgi:hypothetical protein